MKVQLSCGHKTDATFYLKSKQKSVVCSTCVTTKRTPFTEMKPVDVVSLHANGLRDMQVFFKPFGVTIGKTRANLYRLQRGDKAVTVDTLDLVIDHAQRLALGA